MQLGYLAKAASLLIGAFLFLLGCVFLYAYSVGDFVQGRPAAIWMGCSLMLAATPFLAFPFSRQLARAFLLLLLFALAGTFLWLVFDPANPVETPWIYPAAALGFAVLLFARVGLAWFRGRSRLRT